MTTRSHDLSLDETFLRKLESLALSARRLPTGRIRGEHASAHAGSGIAFASHRAYEQGDDLRFVDWQAYARSDRLYVKQFEEERDLSVHFLLDCSGSMAHGDAAKLRYAKQLLAALGYVALVNLDRVVVQAYADQPSARLGALRGRSHALSLLRFLGSLTGGGCTSLARAARSVCARESRSGIALVLSDGYDTADLLTGCDLLRYGKLAPRVLLIDDPNESSAQLDGELTMIDAESGEQHTLRVDDALRKRFRIAREAQQRALVRALGERRVPAFVVSVQTPLERIVLDLLRRGGVVG